MPANALTVTATFEDGALHPEQPLPLAPQQKVTLLLQIPVPTDPSRETAGQPNQTGPLSGQEAALAEALELDLPTLIEMPRRRPLTLLDPDAAIVTEL
jgi:hypothetical protein